MNCALALVLAMDVSGSVSDADFLLQRDATAAALEAPAVAQAARDRLALAVTMWGSAQHQVMGWRVLEGAADTAMAARALRRVERPEGGGTDVAGALRHAVALHADAPCAADRRVIDLSGDGRHMGQPGEMDAAVAAAVAAEIQVNALPIVTFAEPDIAEWYRATVAPTGGFVVAASPEGFARAIRLKITMDVAAR